MEDIKRSHTKAIMAFMGNRTKTVTAAEAAQDVSLNYHLAHSLCHRFQ